jgi:hypothetical protein
VDLVADRFLVCNQETTIDLASGDRVELALSANGGVAEQARWAMRCERLARLHHRSIARLLDYGPIGEAQRFEAWRCDGRWCGSLHESERVRRRVEEMFRASAWTGSTVGAERVRQMRGCAVVLPDAAAGFDLASTIATQAGVERHSSIDVLGITEITRENVAALAEIFSDRAAMR